MEGDMVIEAPQYWRPSLEKMDRERAESWVKAKGITQLAPNMWIIGQNKRWSGKGYNTQVLIKSGKEYFQAGFPTNKAGVIPLDAMAERIMDIADGDRQGKVRNLFVDLAVTAENITKPSDKAKAYTWYLYPNEGDVKGIDDANTKLMTLLPSTSGKRRRSLLIMGGTPDQRDAVVRAIDSAFTLKEKQILAGTMIQIKSLGYRAAGTYASARWSGIGGSVSIITIDPLYATNERASVAVHEAVHAVRDLDETRLTELKRQGSTGAGRDSDFEESMTEAETVGREKPLTTHNFAEAGGGYYPSLAKQEGKNRKDVVVADRVTITKPIEESEYLLSGRKGKKVQRLLKEEFPNTNISKLRIRGGVEAVDTYWKVKNRGGQSVSTQIYSPNATQPPAIQKGELETIQYQDGKAVIVAGRQGSANMKGMNTLHSNVLATSERNDLPDSAFAIPEERKYPIHDKSHARNALARVSAFGTPSEKARVEAAVHARFPSIGQSNDTLRHSDAKSVARMTRMRGRATSIPGVAIHKGRRKGYR